ncbi:MAG: nuclease-related domain-containing protein, partial [Chloroflexota bacterium]
MARLIPLGEAVTRGEKKTLEYLQRHLPEDWVVFGNAMVSTGQLTRELDAIVVGDRAVWVVDDKGFGGVITGDEHTWTLSDGTARERVLDGVLHAAKMVKGRLSSIDSRLAGVWVQGLVLLSAEDAEYHIADERVGDCIRRLAGCEDYFLRAPIPRSRPL